MLIHNLGDKHPIERREGTGEREKKTAPRNINYNNIIMRPIEIIRIYLNLFVTRECSWSIQYFYYFFFFQIIKYPTPLIPVRNGPLSYIHTEN